MRGGEEADSKALVRGTRTTYKADVAVGEGANKPEAQSHPDRTGVDVADRWSEGHASYLGRSAVVLGTARDVERRSDAAAEVSSGHSS